MIPSHHHKPLMLSLLNCMMSETKINGMQVSNQVWVSCHFAFFLDQKGPVQTMTPIWVGSRGGWSPTALHLDNRSVTQTQGYTNSSIVPEARRGRPGYEAIHAPCFCIEFGRPAITLGHANPNPMFCNARTNLLEPSSPSCLQVYSDLPTASTLFTCIHIILYSHYTTLATCTPTGRNCQLIAQICLYHA